MSAAALKPQLFDHLFATRPEGPDRSSLTATLFSIGLHATFAWLIVWASMTMKPTLLPPSDEVITPLVLERVAPVAPTDTRTSGAAGSGDRSSGITYQLPADPIVGIPEPTVAPGPDFATDPAPGGSATDRTPGSGGVGDGPTRDDGFRIVSVMPALLNGQVVRAGARA